jgi:hypothetical protein
MVGLDQGGLESHLSFLFFFAARIRLFRFLFLGLRNGTQCAFLGWRSLFSGCRSAYLFSYGRLFLPYCVSFAFLDTNNLSVFAVLFREPQLLVVVLG